MSGELFNSTEIDESMSLEVSSPTKTYESMSKSTLIQKYSINYEYVTVINSSYHYIVLVFQGAGVTIVVSLLEAMRFQYFRALIETPMKTNLKIFDVETENSQFYYIVPFDLYQKISIYSIEIFNEIHGFTTRTPRIDICKTYLTTCSDESSKKKVREGYEHLCNVFSLDA